MTVRNTRCQRCGRICYHEEGCYSIEAARRLDGSSPAHEYLEELQRNGKQHIVVRFLLRFEDLARDGELIIPDDMNDLYNGLWEIKVSDHRLPFYYNKSHSDYEAVRLTSGFKKRSQRTIRSDINFARTVWSEDLQS